MKRKAILLESLIDEIQKLQSKIDLEQKDVEIKLTEFDKEAAELLKKRKDYQEIIIRTREREKLLAKIENREYVEPYYDDSVFAPKSKDKSEDENEKEVAVKAPPSTDLIANMRNKPNFQEWCEWFCKENGYTIKNINDTSRLEFISTSSDHPHITIHNNCVYSRCATNQQFDKEKLFANMIALYQQGFNEPVMNHKATGMPKKPELVFLLEIRLAETLVRLSRFADTINGKRLTDILSKKESVAPMENDACMTLSSKKEPEKTPSTVMAFQAVYHHDRGRSTLTPVDLFTYFRGRENLKGWCEQFCKKHGYTIANIDDPAKLEFISNNPGQHSIIIQAHTITAAQPPASPDEYSTFAEAYTELYLQALGDKKNLTHKITDCPSAELLDCLERTLAAKLIERGHKNEECINGKSLLLFTSQRQQSSKHTSHDETPETFNGNTTLRR